MIGDQSFPACVTPKVTLRYPRLDRHRGNSVGKRGNGYGSEFHLHHYLDHRRDVLNQPVQAHVGANDVEWLPGPPDRMNPGKLREWKGLEFLADDAALQGAWREIWPSAGNPPNWDAVGRIHKNGAWEWLLVEAKAHIGELASSCTAISGQSRGLITATLAATKQALGAAEERDWLNGYYQYCNRLAVLNFLQQQDVQAHLLFIYFIGDTSGPRRICPQSQEEWKEILNVQKRHVGLPEQHPLSKRVHSLFLPVDLAREPGADLLRSVLERAN